MKVGTIITQEMKNDCLASWSEAEEITANFDQMTRQELIDNLQSIKHRAESIRNQLGKYFTDDDIIDNL